MHCSVDVPWEHPCNGVKVKQSRPHQAPPTGCQCSKEQSRTLKSAAWHWPQNQIKVLILIIFQRSGLAVVSIRDLLWPNEPLDVTQRAAPAAFLQKVTRFSQLAPQLRSSLLSSLWRRRWFSLLLSFALLLVVPVVVVVGGGEVPGIEMMKYHRASWDVLKISPSCVVVVCDCRHEVPLRYMGRRFRGQQWLSIIAHNWLTSSVYGDFFYVLGDECNRQTDNSISGGERDLWRALFQLPPSRSSQSEWLPVALPTRNVSYTAPTNKTLTSSPRARVSEMTTHTHPPSFLSLDAIPSCCTQRGARECGPELVGNVMAVKGKIHRAGSIAWDTHMASSRSIILDFHESQASLEMY